MEQERMGACTNCGKEFSKRAMRSHVATCFAPAKDGIKETIIQLLVAPPRGSDYWLYLDVKATVALTRIDEFLRNIWLECCGHLSCFLDNKKEVPKRRLVGDCFYENNVKLDYEYDFGSTTELTIKAVRRRQGVIGKRLVELLARNNPPVFKCYKCGKPAEVLCQYCMDDDFFFCIEHAEEHGCANPDEYLPVVNSPRMGVCGYTGD